MAKQKHGNEPTVIKKYANRRLYDTGRSSYVTLDDLCEMIKDGYDFVVYDAKSGDDITRSVLTQIIAEKETTGGENMLPTGFLRNLIGFYGGDIQPVVPNYLESTLDLFVKNQERVREQINKSFEGMNPMNTMKGMGVFGAPGLEEMKRQNMAMFERTMKMFNPFSIGGYAANQEQSKEDKISTLKKSIEEIEQEIDRLAAE